jgi:single-stranded-DNA-specific exonuclease
VIAAQLEEMNTERRGLQARMQAEAEAQLDGIGESAAAVDGQASCLYDPGWHEGIVGLVASRLKERTGLPAIAFAPAEDPQILKGSARSVDGIHVRDVLAAVAARGIAPEMIFGGHAMAAGLRLPVSRFEAFRQAFADEVRRQLDGIETGRVLWTDGPLDSGQLALEFAEQLHFGGPWGQGFPEPLFENEFDVLDCKMLKDAHLRLTLQHPDGGEPVEAMAFNETRVPGDRARIVYHLGINDYYGQRRQQLVVKHIDCV